MDFLAVGDVVVDAFIKLKDASVHCKISNEDCEICMRWGDKIPYDDAWIIPAVGNSANAAVAAARLGLASGLRAYVGTDQWGQECLASLLRERVDTAFVERQAGKQTNYHYVLWYEQQRTILVKHETFDYGTPPMATGPTWLYLSSLAQNSLEYHHALIAQIKRWGGTKLAFQPGTFQLNMGVAALREVYLAADIFFCNKEEAERVLTLPAGTDMHQLLRGIKELGPRIVVITDDTRGSFAIDPSGHMIHCPRYPDPRAPYEITGAGDALASTTTVALSMGKPLDEALRWGSVNASAVLQEVGAQKGLLNRAQIETTLLQAPATWVVESF